MNIYIYIYIKGGRQWKINILQLDLVEENNSKIKMKKAFFDIFENVHLIQEFRVQNLLNKVEKKISPENKTY